MTFVGIVASGLVTGSYYNVGGESEIDALKTSKTKYYSDRSSQRTLRDWSKNHSLRRQIM